MRHKIILFISLYILSQQVIYAQFSLNYKAEANIVAGGGLYTPSLLANNRHGLVSLTPNNGYLNLGIFKDIELNRKFSYGFGVNLVGSYNNDAPVYLQQAYIDLKYNCLGLTVGSKEFYSLLEDPSLSSGGMVWSGNARPIPQINVGIPHFVNIPLTNGWVQIKGEIAYGMFIDNKYQKKTRGVHESYSEDILYHRKYLMFKFEKDAPFYGIIGIDMAAQFGGNVYYPNNYTLSFPSTFKTFCKVFVPLSGDSNDPGIDQVNIVGNHLGSYLMEFGYKRNDWKLRAYYEHYFDDHSGMIFKNKIDGLLGIEFRTHHKSYLTGIVVEYMSASNQSGPFLWDTSPNVPIQVSGGDNYYGHASYPGWAHHGMTMGTPLITSPDYNTDGYLGFKNTRVRAFHLGADGYLNPELKYRVLSSFQNGWGTPYTPTLEIKHNFSALVELQYLPRKLSGWTFGFSGALDRGNTMGNNWGLQLNIQKTGILFKKKS